MSLKLVSLNGDFYKDIYNWRSDPVTTKYNPVVLHTFEEFSKKMDTLSSNLEELYSGKDFKWAIVKDNILLSHVSLKEVNAMMKTASIGYQVNPKYRNQGIGLQSVYLLVSTVFAKTNIRKLTASIADENVGSYKIVEKIGFKQEGLLRKHYIINEQEVDERFYGIFRHELVTSIM